VHGVPGGENMMAFENGMVRYFTVREADVGQQPCTPGNLARLTGSRRSSEDLYSLECVECRQQVYALRFNSGGKEASEALKCISQAHTHTTRAADQTGAAESASPWEPGRCDFDLRRDRGYGHGFGIPPGAFPR
jgi:hypothetical protein